MRLLDRIRQGATQALDAIRQDSQRPQSQSTRPLRPPDDPGRQLYEQQARVQREIQQQRYEQAQREAAQREGA